MDISSVSQNKGRTRVAFLDLLRIIACFFVIINHTNAKIFSETELCGTWFASVGYFFLSKAAVPVFLMITGYTMLDRQDSYRKTLGRFIRYGITLLLFSGVYYVANYLSGLSHELSLKGFLMSVIGEPITKAYWYLYTYLGIVLMMPFIQKLALAMEKKDFHVYFLCSGLFLSVWPVLAHYVPEFAITEHFTLPIFNSYLCMLLLGCYVKRYCPPSKKWRYICLVIWLATSLINVLLTYGDYLRFGGKSYLFFDSRDLLPIIAGGACFFYAVSTVRIGGGFEKIIRWLSPLTFGIYLLSDLLINRLQGVYAAMLGVGLHPMIAIVAYEVLIFGVGAGITAILKKIPVIKAVL